MPSGYSDGFPGVRGMAAGGCEDYLAEHLNPVLFGLSENVQGKSRTR